MSITSRYAKMYFLSSSIFSILYIDPYLELSIAIDADHKIIRSNFRCPGMGMQAAKIINLTDKAFYTVCYFTVKVSSVLTQCQVVCLLK
jgi:hypothetical protein